MLRLDEWKMTGVRDHHQPGAMELTGELLGARQRHHVALGRAKTARATRPGDPYSHLRCGALLELAGELEPALACYAQAVVAADDSRDAGMKEAALENKARVLNALGRHLEARAANQLVLVSRFDGEDPASAEAYALAARYADALERFRDPAPENRSPIEKLQLAALLYLVGDRDGYAALCRGWKPSEKPQDDSAQIELLAMATALGLAPEADGKRLSEVTVQALAQSMYVERRWIRPRLLMHALAQFRAGEFHAAIETCAAANHQRNPACWSATLAIKAMALQQLGDEKTARSTLQKIYTDLNPHDWRTIRATVEDRWHTWLIARILLDEAQQMIPVVNLPSAPG